MNRRLLIVGAATAALLAGCATTPRAPLKLTVLHTNDHHGRFWPNGDGEYGLAARKSLIDKVRATKSNSEFFDSMTSRRG